jgi:hypothetical protein
MIRTFPFFAAAASLSLAAALAAEPTPEAGKDRLVCRGSARQLGSHIRTARRCRTAEQWQEEDQAKERTPVSLQVTQGQNDGRPARAPQ